MFCKTHRLINFSAEGNTEYSITGPFLASVKRSDKVLCSHYTVHIVCMILSGLWAKPFFVWPPLYWNSQLHNFWPLLCPLSINELNGPPTHTCRAHSAANGEQTSPSSPLEDELQSSRGWICIPPAEPEPESCRNPFHAITLDAAECSLWVKLAPLILRTPTPPHRPPSPFHFLFFHFPSEGEFGHKREDMKATSSFQCDTLQIQMKTTERATHDTDTNGPKMDIDDVGDSSAAACDSS